MKGKKRPTLADVAQHAQVSTATISRMLRNTGPVSQDLRQRIETSIAALGYAPRPGGQPVLADRPGGRIFGEVSQQALPLFFNLWYT